MPRKDDYEPTNIPGIVKLKNSGKYLATADLGSTVIKDPVTGLKRRKQNKKSKTCDTLREAQNFLAEARREKNKAAKSGSSGKITFEEAAKDYLEYYEGTEDNPDQVYKEKGRMKRCVAYFQKTKIKDIDTAAIEDFFAWCKDDHTITQKTGREKKEIKFEGITPETLQTYKTTLSSMWKFMRKASSKYGRVSNIAKEADVGKTRTPEKEILSPEELLEIFTFTKNNLNDSAELIVVGLGALAGMRRGEVMGLQWKHILWDEKKIDICQQRSGYHNKYALAPPKGGNPRGKTRAERRARYAALPDTLAALLKDVKAQQEEFLSREILPDDYIYRKKINLLKNNLPGANSVWETWESVQNKHNKQRETKELPPFKVITYHNLRHSFISMCINGKVPQPQVSASVGHKGGGNITMAVYWHDDGSRDDIIEFIDKNFPLYE